MFDSFGQHFRRANQKVERKRCREGEPNFYGLTDGIPSRHDHQQIDITVCVRRAVGVRTKQDDSIRMKLRADPLGELTDVPPPRDGFRLREDDRFVSDTSHGRSLFGGCRELKEGRATWMRT